MKLRQNYHFFADDFFKFIFLWENYCILFQFSSKFVPMASITYKIALVLIMACTEKATSHYLNKWWPSYWHIHASLSQNEHTLLMNSKVSIFTCQDYLSDLWICLFKLINRLHSDYALLPIFAAKSKKTWLLTNTQINYKDVREVIWDKDKIR